MRIDVILRTHNRAALLPGAVASFFAADQTGLAARLLVVDNASTDDTPGTLARLAERFGPRLVRLFEPRPGAQHPLNRGIAASTAEVIAFFDDDERIVPGWLQVIRREFADACTDYIAGPVRAADPAVLPGWLPTGFGGVLGLIDSGPTRRPLGVGSGAMLTQGNCAVRRLIFAEVGPYPDALPTAEDRWLNQWLEAQGKQGFYCPDLVVEHVMQPARITPEYFRRWALREGRDLAVCDRIAGRPGPFSQRWYWRSLAEALWARVRPGVAPSERLRAELNLRVAGAYLREMVRG